MAGSRAIYSADGTQHVGILDAETGELLDLDLPHTAIGYPVIAAEGQRIVFIGGGSRRSRSRWSRSIFTTRSIECCARATGWRRSRLPLVARAIEFPTERRPDRVRPHYPPANADFEAPGESVHR